MMIKPLGPAQALGDQFLQIFPLNLADGIGAALVFEDVDLADVFVAVGFKPLSAQRHQTDGAGVLGHFFELGHRHLQPFGEFIVGRSATQLHFELLVSHVQFVRPGSHEARAPNPSSSGARPESLRECAGAQ